MGKTAVIYASEYGHTKKYASWIAEELGADLFNKSEIKPDKLKDYDLVIFGGGLYAGGVNGINLITRNYELLRRKKLILFTCGIADPSDTENAANIREGLCRTFPDGALQNIHLFNLRGGIDYGRLSLIHRGMIAMMKRVLEKKDPRSLSGEDRMVLESYGNKIDMTDRSAIAPILECARGLL